MGHEEKPIRTEHEEWTIPVAEEHARVDKRAIETGRVRVTRAVNEEEVHVEDVLIHHPVTVERVPVGRFIEEPVSIRYEDDTIIVPVVEEVPIVVKRLRLKEEVHITSRPIEECYRRPVVVRRAEVTVERTNDVSPHEATKSQRSTMKEGSDDSQL